MTDSVIQVDAVPDLERALEDHRTALMGFCYRMLGSPFDAEDAVQETMVRAWRALDRFEGRAALRSWLFGIATNVCFDALNGRRRRALPMDLGSPAPGDSPLGVPLAERFWVAPVADGRVIPTSGDPADAAVTRESIRLAFVAALQHLNPRQRAVLILRDVLRWKASEVAQLLDCTTVSVNSILRRARAVLADAAPAGAGGSDSDRTSDEVAGALVDRYVDAFARYDVDAIVALLHDDVVLSMPPYPLWVRGVADVRAWYLAAAPACRATRFVSTVANGSPAVAAYRPTGPNGSYEPFAIQVMDVSGGRIVSLHAFLDPTLFRLFDVPHTLGG